MAMSIIIVKPLEWNSGDEAKGAGAKYLVYEGGNGWNAVCYTFEESHFRIGSGLTEYEARLAAQEDHERRLASFLEAIPTHKPLQEEGRGVSDHLVARLNRAADIGDITTNDWMNLSSEAANHIEALEALIQEMREALESAKEELYYISHSSCDPDDEKNMDSVACSYRDCRNALSKAKSKQEGETE